MKAPAAAIMHGPLEVPRDHPAFAGHFPRFPVLPGAVLLDEALQAIAHERGIDLTQWHIATAKFHGAVRPGDALRLEHTAPDSALIRFTILAPDLSVGDKDRSVRGKDRTVASGSLSRAAAAP